MAVEVECIAVQISPRAAERWMLGAAVLATSMAFIDATALNVAAPALQAALGATGPELLWVVNAYALPVASLLLLCGSLGDRFGRKQVFIAGIGLFALASAACSLAIDARVFIAARALQGVGGAMMIPGSLALIAAGVAPERLGRAIGVWTAGSVIATAAGPVIGGLLARGGLWRAVFWINVPIAAAALWILLTKTPSPQRPRMAVALDWRGGLLGAMFLGLLNYALIEAAARGFQDPRVFGCLAGAAAALVLFVRVESRASRPMLPPALFRVRTFSAACLLTLAFYSSLYGLLFFLSLNLIQVQEYDAALAGLAQLPVMLLVAILAPWSGRLVDRRGPRLPLAVGASLASLGFLLLARVGLTAGPADYWQSFFPPLVLLGAAMGFVLVPLSAMIMSAAHGERAGVSSAMNAALSRLSSVLGIAILGPIVLVAFEQSLKDRTSVLPLGAEQRRVLLFQASRLAEAQPPPDLPPLEYRAAKNAIKAAFVTAFQLVSLVCAAAVALAAALVLIMTRKRHNPAHDASGRN